METAMMWCTTAARRTRRRSRGAPSTTRALVLAATSLVLLACGPAGDDRAATAQPGTDTMRAEPQPPAAAPRPAPPPPELPRFEEYAVADTTFRGRPAPVQLRSAEYGRTYRTKLREGADSGPNFAGRYTVVLWGCGSNCQIVAVVDARTGRLSRQTLHTMNGVAFRRSSALIVADPIDPANPPPDQCASCGTPAAYVWRGGRFEPVGRGAHPHLGGPRPW